MPQPPKFEVVVTGVTAVAVDEGYWPLDEARIPLRLAAFLTLREAKEHLVELAQAEAEKRGLVVNPFDLPKLATGPRWLPEALSLIRPEDVEVRSGGRQLLAQVKVKRIPERPASYARRAAPSGK